MVDYTKSFIETQFPVSKVSKESYKERKANLGQTLTGLGKWWGRKPLILVRATILGVLMPVSDNPKKDREIFLKILTMDNDGLYLRKFKNLSTTEIFSHLTTKERDKYFSSDSTEENPKYKKGIKQEEKDFLQKITFNRLSYDDKIIYCNRPEHIDNLPEKTWEEINEHLGTSATSFNELTAQLGEKRYGHRPILGDCFAGGGSIAFEGARLGCDIYASDLNPIASLLTWSAINILGDSDEKISELRDFQQKVYDEVDKQITEWNIEHNEKGHRADSYLYCNEVICPECGHKVPLAPSWVIGKGTRTVALLKDNGIDGFKIEIIQGAIKKDFEEAESKITIRKNNMYCPHCNKETSIISLRNDRKDKEGNTIYGLRKWERNEFIPRKEDLYKERLYCIRYVEEYKDNKGNIKTRRYYTSPTKEDLKREQKVIDLLSERFTKWQEEGYVPSSIIENGDKTDEPIRTRGWQYWHQLFNARQLLVHGLYVSYIDELSTKKQEYLIGLLGLNKLNDWNSKLSVWDSYSGCEIVKNTFMNQALNTSYNYGTRAFTQTKTSWFFNINNFNFKTNDDVIVKDARNIDKISDIWITDPPYADAVNYHELTEFFLAWDKKILEKAFPYWYTDSKRVLAVKGIGKTFNDSMIEIYKNLANHMPYNGTQVVMFTHQDVKVWAELALILWSSGLQVVSAWTIATETESGGLKNGNYVQGTVLLVLKKQKSNEVIFTDILYEEIKGEVKSQIDSMRDLDDKEDPNFSDGDYMLASYVACLKVLTSYKEIEGINVEYELSKIRDSKEESPIVQIINKAKRMANDYLIPNGIDKQCWTKLTQEERFYIKGLEIESNNVYQISAYQELARSYGINEYKDMFENFTANTVRLKTATEYRSRGISNEGFGSSMLRHILVALYLSSNAENTLEGRNYLRNTFDKDNMYWNSRSLMINILEFLSRFETIGHMEHWRKDSYYGKLLKESIRNDVR